jgi:hypothetical protein
MKRSADLERDFDQFFASVGFQRVSDIVGQTPPFPNADYIALQSNTVVELKVMDKDFFAEGGVIDRFCGFVPKPMNVDDRGYGAYSVAWPAMNREGRCDTFEEPLRRVLKKANRQVRETINRLLDGTGWGFVFIALNGFASVHPELVRRMVDALLTDEFSALTGYILCTPGWGIIPGGSNVAEGFCHGSVLVGTPPEIESMWNTIGENWCHFATAGGHADAANPL